MLTKRVLALAVVGIVAGVAIFLGVDAWVGGRAVITVGWQGRPVELLDPRWLKLVCVVPFFYVVRTASLTDLSVLQQVVQSTLRGAVIAAIAIAMARPSWVTRDDKVATVVLVDVSDSVSDAQLEAARAWIAELDRARSDGDTLQVVTFAERPVVAARNEIVRHAGAGAGTDIQAAMRLGYALYPRGYLPRMVVLSDGNQTRGDVLAESYRAHDLGVRVSWRAFAERPVEEIRVIGVSVPDEVKQAQRFEVTGEVWSTHEEEVELTLFHERSLEDPEQTRKVKLHEGKNRIAFQTEVKHDKSATYRLRLSKYRSDTEKANNEAVIATPVKGRPHVLYVEGSVQTDPSTAGYLRKALEHEDIDVEVRGPRSLPASIDELREFDLVLISDVPAYLVNPGQMNALDAYVRDGGGLIMAGGEDSFGSGGYQGTRIEKIMPVRFDTQTDIDEPAVAMILVIDRSGSMDGPKLEAAKTAARATVEVLEPSDRIGVVAFDDYANTIVEPTPAREKRRISTDISRIRIGGGTNIHPGLLQAFELLKDVPAKVKHVIVLSDGEAPEDGIADLVGDMRAAGITVSTVGIAGADQGLLATIADLGGGRHEVVHDLGNLPRFFVKETTQVKKGVLVEDDIDVLVAKRVEMIEGTGVDAAPPLHGYVATKPKPTSEVVLIAPNGEPILARWRHGAGWSVAWTSDVKNRWSADWIRWAGYPKFWAQVVRTTMKRKMWTSYEMATTVDDGRAQVVVDAIDPEDRFINELDTELQVIDPATHQPTLTVPMEQTAAGRYTADFPIEQYGSFLLKAVHKRAGKQVAETEGTVSLPYPLEYLKTTPHPEPLQHAALVTGGADAVVPAAVWEARGESVAYVEDLWPWVLLAAAALFLVDLYLKRVRFFGYRTMRFE